MKHILLTVLIACAACNPESTGKLAASEEGDLSHRLATRTQATATFEAECGDANITPLGFEAIRRAPYLQQTTPYGTRILWTSGSSGELPIVSRPTSDKEDAPIVEVSTPDGTIVKTLRADPQSSAGSANQWRATVDGLRHDTVYCYEIRDTVGEVLVERVGFRTAPLRGGDAPVRFAVLGDSGDGSSDQQALVEYIPTVPLDFLVHVGDMAYGAGSFTEFEDYYFSVYEEIFRHFTVFPVAGNHEYGTDEAAPFREVFDLPNNERYYSVDWGNVHFVGLDTEVIGPEQAKWLREDLAASDMPWTVVFMHKPPYSSGAHGSEAAARETFSPIFSEHGVDLVLTGHDHHYERTKPMKGVHYIVTGGGGAGTRSVSPADFSAFALEVVHFLYIEVDGKELAMHAIDATGKEFDQLVLSHE